MIAYYLSIVIALTVVDVRAVMHDAALLSAPTYMKPDTTTRMITCGSQMRHGAAAMTTGKKTNHKNFITWITLLLSLQ